MSPKILLALNWSWLFLPRITIVYNMNMHSRKVDFFLKWTFVAPLVPE